MEARKLSVSISRPMDEAYEFLSVPENFPKWASGLARSLQRVGEEWVAETPEGRATVRFTERNRHGVLDHAVTLPGGTTVYVPLRIVPKGPCCELVLTVFRRPGTSNESFAADAQWVLRDLTAAKHLLEQA